MVEMTIVGGQIRDLAGRFIDFAVPELLTVFGGWRGISTFAVLRFRDQRWVGSCLTSRAGLTLTVAQRAMP
jgi:hypothetical protein